MPPKKLSVSEIKAVAEAAITAKTALDAAKSALDASPDDESLKTKHQEAETVYTAAKSKADALSQVHDDDPVEEKRKQKLLRKRAIIDNELRTKHGVTTDDDDDDDLDLDDPERVVTVGDLARIEARKSTQTAKSMAGAIEDADLRKAVESALADVVPSGDPTADFKKAVAIANIDKNSKVLEEIGRRVYPPQHRSGAGAPPRPMDAEFVPTAEEARYMKAFGLSKEDVLRARAATEKAAQ